MKQILISIKPEWVAKILSGEKTLEIRKTAPKEFPCEVYIYCTKGLKEGILVKNSSLRCIGFVKGNAPKKDNLERLPHIRTLNGKVVAKFTLDRVFIIHNFFEGLEATEPTNRHITIYDENELLKESCLRRWQIVNYGGVYAWHISDLEIFDEPKKLSEFKLNRAPQSWCYVEEKE